jgi:hypothetical protein
MHPHDCLDGKGHRVYNLGFIYTSSCAGLKSCATILFIAHAAATQPDFS